VVCTSDGDADCVVVVPYQIVCLKPLDLFFFYKEDSSLGDCELTHGGLVVEPVLGDSNCVLWVPVRLL